MGTITHEKCRLGRFRSVLKCYSLWIKWVLKFLILWSDEINHSNFESATKCLNKSWWYLLKHARFILKLKDFCNTCVHFQWKKTNSSRHIGILSALRMRGLHDKRQLLAKLRIAGSENYFITMNHSSLHYRALGRLCNIAIRLERHTDGILWRWNLTLNS